ncbi:MAG: hypothetical protein Fur0011_2840 [Candidatus Microgenomates bacterium]
MKQARSDCCYLDEVSEFGFLIDQILEIKTEEKDSKWKGDVYKLPVGKKVSLK